MRPSSTMSSLLQGDQSGKVVPLEERVGLVEAVSLEQVDVLLDPVGNEHVLERLSLLGDLGVRVAIAALHLVVELDERPVQPSLLADDLLDQDQASARTQPSGDVLDQAITVQRSHELERQVENDDGR